jgi:hypothetical protein
MNPEVKQYDEKINNIKGSFFSALDDFKKYYVYYNKNPEVNEFQNYFSNSKDQLQGLSSDLFLITNNIQQNIQDLDTEIKITSMKLDAEKKLNEELLILMKKLETTQDGSKIMIDDAKEEYNIQYYKNLELLVGILILIRIIIKFY